MGDCYLEKTADKRFTNKLKRHFSKDTLYITKVEGFFPDLTGFVKTQYATDLITVEVKAKGIAIRDIFQAKEQAEIFDAKYSLLVSTETIPEEIRRFAKDRPSIMSFSDRKRVLITQFDEDTEELEIDKELYYGSLPEPFKSHREAFEAENLTLAVDFNKKHTMVVVVTNAGNIPTKVTEVKLGGQALFQNVTLQPYEQTRIEIPPTLSNWYETVRATAKIELTTEIGKKFSFEVKLSQ